MVKQRRGEAMAPPAGEDAEEQPPADQPEPGEGEEEAPPPPAAEHEDAVPDEWPVSAKARVKEEAEKRRKATRDRATIAAERDQWKQTAQQLKGRLDQTAIQQIAPPATPEDPLADVMDGPGLLKARQQFWEMLQFAEEHPDGVDDYLLGTDAKGQEIRMDYDRKDIVKMKMTALEVLGQGIAQKAAFLQEVDRYAAEAKEAMPELFSEEPNEANQIAQQFLRALPPQIRSQFAKWPVYLADLVRGEMERQAKGKGQGRAADKNFSATARAIQGAPKFKVAPSMPRTRAVEAASRTGGSRDVEIQKAKQAHIDSGFSSETLERLIAIKRMGTQRTGSRTPALV
jgi:hypothetical protein